MEHIVSVHDLFRVLVPTVPFRDGCAWPPGFSFGGLVMRVFFPEFGILSLVLWYWALDLNSEIGSRHHTALNKLGIG
jgi:hypothetical protein